MCGITGMRWRVSRFVGSFADGRRLRPPLLLSGSGCAEGRCMKFGRIAMGLVYIGAGICHWTATRLFMAVVPDYLPAHRGLVLVSGVAEIAGGVGVLVPAARRPAAWGLILLLIAVFPANLWMAQHPERFRSVPEWTLWARLPLQVVLIWWAWLYARRTGQ